MIQFASAFQVLPSALTFPSTAVGSSSATMDAIIANGTTTAIHTSQPVLSDTKDFTATGDCSTIDPGNYCTVTFTFTPQTSGALTATYSISDMTKLDDPLIVNLSGAATGSAESGSLSPANVGFGSEVINHGTTKVVTYTNSASSQVTISGKTITPSVFTVATDNCGSTVAASSSCTYVLFFEPTAVQTYAGTFTVMDGGSNPSVALTGTGTASSGSETLTPASIDFGTVLVGQTANQTVTYTNNGSVSVEVFNYANTNPAFSVIASTCTVNVAANSSCTYTLQFAPTVAGSQTSTFEVLDKNSNPTATLTGTTYITSPQTPPANAQPVELQRYSAGSDDGDVVHADQRLDLSDYVLIRRCSAEHFLGIRYLHRLRFRFWILCLRWSRQTDLACRRQLPLSDRFPCEYHARH